LNSCHSAAQIKNLVETVPFAIGMADEIGDGDAITYAARFYAAVADGQSVRAAHNLGRAAVELAGLPDHELPTLLWPGNPQVSTPPLSFAPRVAGLLAPAARGRASAVLSGVALSSGFMVCGRGFRASPLSCGHPW
jgi:hypothetical protein